MRIDLYTKTILTLIALLLAVFTLRPILQPQAAMAQGADAGIQFSYSGGHAVLQYQHWRGLGGEEPWQLSQPLQSP